MRKQQIFFTLILLIVFEASMGAEQFGLEGNGVDMQSLKLPQPGSFFTAKFHEENGEKYFLVNEGEYINEKFVILDYVQRPLDFDEFIKESYMPELGYMSHYKFFSFFDPGLTPEELYIGHPNKNAT